MKGNQNLPYFFPGFKIPERLKKERVVKPHRRIFFNRMWIFFLLKMAKKKGMLYFTVKSSQVWSASMSRCLNWCLQELGSKMSIIQCYNYTWQIYTVLLFTGSGYTSLERPCRILNINHSSEEVIWHSHQSSSEESNSEMQKTKSDHFNTMCKGK